MNGEIDTLQLNIVVNSKDATDRLTNIQNAVDGIIASVQPFDKASKELGDGIIRIGLSLKALPKGNLLGDTTTQIKQFSNAISRLNVGVLQTNVNTLKNAINALSVAGMGGKMGSVGRFVTQIAQFSTTISNLDTGKFSASIQSVVSTFEQAIPRLTTAITPFIQTISNAKTELVAFSNILNKTNANINTVTNKVKKSEKTGGGSWGLYRAIIRLAVVYRLLYRISRVITGVVEKGINFNETLNLWQVAMRGNLGQATQFVDEMSKAYGYATTTLMQYQATFRNMVSALGGISADASYTISEALVAFGTDFASLYNTTLETAMEKLQAVLAGQIRPIRAISGYDVSKNTIYELYKTIGGKKAQSEITETEKRLLRVYAVMVQMENAGALGDMEKTLQNSANQLRIMKELAKEFFTWIGNGINALFESSGIFKKINTYLYAAIELAKSFAYKLGYTEKNFTLNTQFEEVNEQIDEAQGKLASFDKFNVLSDSGKGEDSVSQNIISAITAQVEAWKENMRNSENYMSLLNAAQAILEKVGLTTENITNDTGDLVSFINTLRDTIKEVVLLSKVVTVGVLPILKALSPLIEQVLKLVGSILPDISSIVQVILPFVQTLVEKLVPPLVRLLQVIEPIIKTILNLVADVLPSVIDVLDPIVDIVGSLVDFIASAVSLVSDLLKLFIDFGKSDFGFLDTLSILFNGKASGLGWLNNLKDGIQGIAQLLNLIFGILRTITLTFGSLFQTITMLIDNIQKFFTGDWDNIDWGKIKDLWEKVVADALYSLWTNILVKIVGAFKTIATRIENIFKSIGSAKNWFGTLGSALISPHADGGLATKGSLFLAGEAGPELVTRTSGGNSTIMNMQQLEDAVARGFMRAFIATDNEGQTNITINLGGRTIATIYDLMKTEGKRRGESW